MNLFVAPLCKPRIDVISAFYETPYTLSMLTSSLKALSKKTIVWKLPRTTIVAKVYRRYGKTWQQRGKNDAISTEQLPG